MVEQVNLQMFAKCSCLAHVYFMMFDLRQHVQSNCDVSNTLVVWSLLLYMEIMNANSQSDNERENSDDAER